MNRTVNQLVNALHLDPKREAAVRKIIENAGGVNDSTPVVNEISGNELLPINVNGENKAVSAAALVKGAKEVYVLDIFNYKTEEDYQDLLKAFNDGKIILADGVTCGIWLDNRDIKVVAYTIIPIVRNNESALVVSSMELTFKADGTFNNTHNDIKLLTGHGGTKFLSDDGTYKEVGGGSEPYIISDTTSANDLYSYLSESTEINERFNPNIIIDYLDGGGLYYSGKCIELTKDNNIFYLICTGVGSNPGGWGTVPFVLICTSESITVENYVRFINNTEYSLTLDQRGALNNLPYSRIPYVLGTHTIKEEWDYLNYYYQGSPYIPFNNVFVEINDGSTTYYGYAHSIYYDNDGYVIQCIGSVGIFGSRLSNKMFTFVLTEENGYELVDETDESIPKKIENLENAVYNGPVIIEIELEGDGITLTDEEIEAIRNQNVKIKYNKTVGDISSTVTATPIVYGEVDTNTIVMLTKSPADNGGYEDLQCVVDTNTKTLLANVVGNNS